MTLEEYQAFTDTLQRNLEQDDRVIGLVAAGSMAGEHHLPDRWSDHDFLVIVFSSSSLPCSICCGLLPNMCNLPNTRRWIISIPCAGSSSLTLRLERKNHLFGRFACDHKISPRDSKFL
jgi:hypothetical protein